MDSCEKFPVRHINSKDIPVWGEAALPPSAQLLMFVTEQDRQCGQYLPFIYKLPTNSVIPGGLLSQTFNIYSLAGNGASFNVPEGQVRAGFVHSSTPNDIRLADADGSARFIILGSDPNNQGSYLVQGSGIYTFQGNHPYIVGLDYFLGEDGTPVTSGEQHLFTVLDSRSILINIGV